MSRLWLMRLPSTDAAFAPLHRAADMDPADFPHLRSAHEQAIYEAAWGAPLETLDARAEELHRFALHDGQPCDAAQAGVWRRDALEALGYALGVTAVRVALRERRERLTVAEVA